MQEDTADNRQKACRFILASVLFGAKYAKNFDLSSVNFDNPVHNTIAEFIKGKQKSGEAVRASAIFDIVDEKDAELSQILDLSVGEGLQGAQAEKYFRDCLQVLNRAEVEAKLARLSRLCDAETDLEKKREITREILRLTIQLKNF